MQKTNSTSDAASKQLYRLLIKASNIINKRCLLGDDGTFDPSETNLIPQVEQLLKKNADPQYNLMYKVPGRNGGFGMKLPTSLETVQRLGYKDIERLMLSKKEKLK